MNNKKINKQKQSKTITIHGTVISHNDNESWSSINSPNKFISPELLIISQWMGKLSAIGHV